MDKQIPPLPKGYMPCPIGMAYEWTENAPPALWNNGFHWLTWGPITKSDWLGVSSNFVEFAIPKPHYACPLEFSREVSSDS